MSHRTTWTGACHCRNIRFTFESGKDPSELQGRRCACSFCTKHGNVYVSDPAGALDITIDDRQRVSRYSFGHATAEFLVCRTCGVMPVIVSHVNGAVHGAVNRNAVDGIEAVRHELPVFDFDGETPEERLARRRKNWIGRVTGAD